MTLEDLKTRCETQGFSFAYGLFKEAVDPPHLVCITGDSDNFMADDKVWRKDTSIQLDYTYEDKNITEMNTIENIILGDIAWNKTEEIYLPDERVWQVSYYFDI